MFKLISDLFGATINAWALFYTVFRFSNKNMTYKSKQLWICILCYAVYLIIGYKITDNFIRVLINYLVLALGSFWMIKGNIVKTMLNSLISFFIFSLAEFIFLGLAVFGLNIDMNQYKEVFLLSLMSNVALAMIAYCITNLVVSRKIFKEIINKRQEKNNKMIIVLFVMTCITISILMYTIYFDLPERYALFLHIILLITFFVLAISIFLQTNKNDQLQEDYDLRLNELAEYEKTLSEKRRLLHNHDNDLICIRGMIKNPKVNKKAIDYINELLEETKDHDSIVLQKSELIPEGGLQGIIHKKIDIMKTKNISVYLHVEESINELNFDKLSLTQNKDICTIIGIFLDNALEAAEIAKEKNISIVLNKNKKDLVITISNTYKDNIDLSKIDEEGYSTKGNNRGYGLDIVRKIIDSNDYLKNERQILGNIFSQKLVVKVK